MNSFVEVRSRFMIILSAKVARCCSKGDVLSASVALVAYSKYQGKQRCSLGYGNSDAQHHFDIFYLCQNANAILNPFA